MQIYNWSLHMYFDLCVITSLKISFDLLIHFANWKYPLTSKTNKWINQNAQKENPMSIHFGRKKRQHKPDVVRTVAYYKMNKTRCNASRLWTFIRLKCKNKVAKNIFQQIKNFPSKSFWSRVFPLQSYKKKGAYRLEGTPHLGPE